MLSAIGIDAPRYWLLIDLFDRLAERREMMNHLGRDGVTLKMASWLYVLMGGFACLIFLRHPPDAARFLGTFMAFTALLLGCILVSEAGNSLVNPVEGLVLAHQPIDGATYTAAKLTHLLRIVAFLDTALNAVPAVASLLLLKHPFWYYPLIHLAATFLAGLLVALFACALFGWLLRFVPAPRLKSAGQLAEALPFVGAMFGGQIWGFLSPRIRTLLPPGSPIRGYLAIVLPLAAVAAVVTGIRALSGDYLVRVATIVHGGGGGRMKSRRSRVGDAVARWLGGPPARAGFAYTARMMRRDWTFRRQLIPMIPLAISPVALLTRSARTDPFSGGFTGVHMIPHVFGIALFMIAIAMVYGSDYKGAWMFQLAPSGAFDGFARGVYGLLWFSIVGVPHAVLLAPLAWYWGLAHAALFVAFSMAVVSVYLGLELRLVDGIPFSKPPVASRGAVYMGIMFVGALAIAIAVGLQYLLVFRSAAVVAVVTAVAAVTAWLVTRASLDGFATAMRFNLGLESAAVGPLYTEIDV